MSFYTSVTSSSIFTFKNYLYKSFLLLLFFLQNHKSDFCELQISFLRVAFGTYLPSYSCFKNVELWNKLQRWWSTFFRSLYLWFNKEVIFTTISHYLFINIKIHKEIKTSDRIWFMFTFYTFRETKFLWNLYKFVRMFTFIPKLCTAVILLYIQESHFFINYFSY